MNLLYRLRFVLAILAVLAVVIAPAAAQEGGFEPDPNTPGPGEGGTIFAGNAGGDISTFNPIISSDGSSNDVITYMFPALFTLNPQTLLSEPNQLGALASGWEYDETGTVLTMTLREDLTWNDGTPITAADYLYAVNAIQSGQTSSARTYVFETLADGTPAGGKLVSVEALDDFTLQFTFSEADCIAFEDLNDIPVVPSHVFNDLFGTDYASMDEDPLALDLVQTTYGPFTDPEFVPGERVSLIADQTYVDSTVGYVVPSEWVYLNVADTNVELERFLAGEVTYVEVPSGRQNEFRENPDINIFEYSAYRFTFMTYNLADPNNPQSGLDESGNPIDQGLHPVLGDVRVRQAIAHAVDIDAMVEGIGGGNPTRINTHTHPESWAFDPTLENYALDLERAGELLDEAGWVDDDSDPETARVCQGCLYATEVDESYEGTALSFEVQTTAGAVTGELIAQAIQSDLAQVGITVEISLVEFGALLDALDNQTYDAALLAWQLGLPIDPDVASFYTPEQDIVPGGFNFGSYSNPRLTELNAEARVVVGCDREARAELYREVQRILYEDQPYLYVWAPNLMFAVQPDLGNFDPVNQLPGWNLDAWFLGEPQ